MNKPANAVRISIRQLEAFKAMVEAESVTAAALTLRISQPSVSRLLRDLEYSVGFSLFKREKGRLAVTPEARLLYDEIEKYFRDLNTVAQAAADIRALSRGQLRLGSFVALAVAVVPRSIKQFNQAHPDIVVSSTINQSRQIIDLVSSRFIDLGIVDPWVVTRTIRVERRHQFRCVCAVPARHPLAKLRSVTPAHLKGETLIGLEQEFLGRYPAGAKLYEAIAPGLRIQMQQSLSACALVAEGVGIAIVDPFTAMYCAPQGVVAKSLTVKIPFEIAIASSPEAPLSKPAQEFLHHFDAELERICRSVDYVVALGR